MDKIDEQRDLINDIDDQIMSLLDKRFNCTNKIGELKRDQNKEVLDTNREDKIYKKTSKYSHYPEIKHIYEVIMMESKKAQRK